MKQVEIITSKVEMLVVDLPEYITEFTHGGKTGLTIGGHKVKHLGKATELTEEDWGSIVEWNDEKQYYRLYPSKEWQGDITATESGLSLLKANGVVLENELGEKPNVQETIPQHMLNKGYGGNDYVDQLYDEYQWQESESKVWRNCHVFIKEK